MVQLNPQWVATHNQPPPGSGSPIITQLAGTGTAGYFTDAGGTPRVYWADENWGLPSNAGRWNSGNWQADYDNFHTTRAAQGLNANHTHPWGHSHTGANNDIGNTWDGISPWTGGPGGSLNNTFWTRIDYMFTSAAAHNMTIFFNLTMSADLGLQGFAGTGVWNGVSAANAQTAAQHIAARYLNTPNLIWMFGDDYFNDDDTMMNAILAGIRAAGDTRPLAVEYYPTGTTSHIDLSAPGGATFPFGTSQAAFNWVYYYWVTYFGVETAYADANPLPVVWGDGFFWGDAGGQGTNGGHDDNLVMRKMVWWALSSGARGCTMGSDAVFVWGSSSAAAVAAEGWYVNSAKAVRTLFEGLPGWQKLIPDTSSVLVTAGRGTRAAYSNQFFLAGNSDNYVSASRTADGKLAVIYMSVASTITIDQTKMVSGYTAKWADPASGVTASTTTGSTYNSGSKGTNSAGDTDWVLILQGP